MHRFLLHNGRVHDTQENIVTPGQIGLLNGWGVFSTLRVREGVLFAWPRHFARMKKDAELMRVPFPHDASALHSDLLKLIEVNQAFNATLRVCIVRNHGGQFESPGIEQPYDTIAFTKDLTHWSESVRLKVQPNARHGASPFSGAKILSWSANLTWLEQAQSEGFDEMLLLDENGLVSECTSANIFIVQGWQVFTPPLSCGCLPGVTRAILLEEVRATGVSIAERPIALEELAAADDVFITSSTRDLLPVREVGGKPMGMRGDVRSSLLQGFRLVLESYVTQNRHPLQHSLLPV